MIMNASSGEGGRADVLVLDGKSPKSRLQMLLKQQNR
jgi:hypothetical protein